MFVSVGVTNLFFGSFSPLRTALPAHRPSAAVPSQVHGSLLVQYSNHFLHVWRFCLRDGTWTILTAGPCPDLRTAVLTYRDPYLCLYQHAAGEAYFLCAATGRLTWSPVHAPPAEASTRPRAAAVPQPPPPRGGRSAPDPPPECAARLGLPPQWPGPGDVLVAAAGASGRPALHFLQFDAGAHTLFALEEPRAPQAPPPPHPLLRLAPSPKPDSAPAREPPVEAEAAALSARGRPDAARPGRGPRGGAATRPQLPLDMLRVALEALDRDGVMRCRLVCRAWAVAAEAASVWSLCLQRYGPGGGLCHVCVMCGIIVRPLLQENC